MILLDWKKEIVIFKVIKFGIRVIVYDVFFYIYIIILKRIYIDSNSKISNCKDIDRVIY